jgi:hypothetical protein
VARLFSVIYTLLKVHDASRIQKTQDCLGLPRVLWNGPSSKGIRKTLPLWLRMNAVADMTLALPPLHYNAAAVALLRSVGVVASVNLSSRQRLVRQRGRLIRTVPHREGTIQSLGSLSVNAIKLRAGQSKCPRSDSKIKQRQANRQAHSIAASDTGIRRRSRSSRRRWLSSVRRRSFSSAMLCFLLLPSPPVRISYGAAAIVFVIAGIVCDERSVVQMAKGVGEGCKVCRERGAMMRCR